jgi:hypothetical protein
MSKEFVCKLEVKRKFGIYRRSRWGIILKWSLEKQVVKHELDSTGSG